MMMWLRMISTIIVHSLVVHPPSRGTRAVRTHGGGKMGVRSQDDWKMLEFGRARSGGWVRKPSLVEEEDS